MKIKPTSFRSASCVCAVPVAVVSLSGRMGTNITYSAGEQMVVATSHNHFMEIGPCGVPWNYDDRLNILLPDDGYKYDSSRLVAYQNGRLEIESGHVILDRTNRIVTIDLTFEGYENGERVPVKCKYNGVHRYVEWEPRKNEVTRQWLQDFYRTNGTTFYEP